MRLTDFDKALLPIVERVLTMLENKPQAAEIVREVRKLLKEAQNAE